MNNLTNPRSIATVTTQVNVAEAKARLSDLVERAANGEDIVIARAGKPRARSVPVPAPPDFDEDLIDLFECLQDDDGTTRAR